jgi:DNA repair exonuclease SbcCD ATPase subunit
LDTRRVALLGSATFLITAFDAEIANMRRESDRLRAKTEALEAHIRENAALKDEADRQAAYRDAAEQDVLNAEDRMAEMIVDIRRINREIGNLDSRIVSLQYQLSNWQTKYTCLAGANYNSCTQHPDWRRQMAANAEQWNRNLTAAKSERSEARAERDRLTHESRQLERDELPALRQQLGKQEEAARRAEEAYTTDEAALDAERKETWKELWTSRADAHTRASESQKQRTAELQGKLSAPLPTA